MGDIDVFNRFLNDRQEFTLSENKEVHVHWCCSKVSQWVTSMSGLLLYLLQN